MIITEDQANEMLEAAKPLIKWMNENCHMMCSAVVDQNSVVIIESISSRATDEFLKGSREFACSR